MDEITQLIRDYYWMKKEILRLETILFGKNIPMGSWGVAQYGIDAAMPKGSSIRSAKELEKMDIREIRQIERLEAYRWNVYALESAADELDSEILKIIYDCLLDNMTYRQIALHLNISKDQVQRQKAEIIRQMRQTRQMRQITANLHKEKTHV
ncbi:sigma-70 family RNA polymerase sigma factor [Paenisporosarcina sp. OV554]|uniref:sigma-70 family RNA polymerase sigma factor n=1 Tax=Paenisporosarcina sp. OV554 TaxID=2135694 RepID=UPI000D3DBB77|nr:sigma-70 family RNA polymerase sigma factor [Paenisporosarcina sp. OV554]PUB12606.1 hypothetical protein C8K15_109105 [Paenisporosarcina sp. OV554]